jgi:putative flavoprotein involved in K+ transport
MTFQKTDALPNKIDPGFGPDDPPDDPLLDVVVIGGSQAGLAIAWHLAQRGLRFLVLDAGPEIGHVWRSRWDSLTLFTPAQYDALPGMLFPAPTDTYPTKDQVADYLQAYAAEFELPVRLKARVTRLSDTGEGFEVRTADEAFRARQVVVATGPFQVPFIPAVASGLDAKVVQFHSAHYRSPAQLPDGSVLVVGGGNSGFQIAEELAVTRNVGLAVGTRMPALPQRLLGRDLFWWLSCLGVMGVSVESRVGRKMAQRDVLIGSSKRRLQRADVTIRKRLERAAGRRAFFADESHLDVDAVVWATGYRPDFSWIDVPGVTDENGRILHGRGVTGASGLYFVGLPWQHTRGSALLGFVKDDAAFIAQAIAASAKDEARPAAPSGSALLMPTAAPLHHNSSPSR